MPLKQFTPAKRILWSMHSFTGSQRRSINPSQHSQEINEVPTVYTQHTHMVWSTSRQFRLLHTKVIFKQAIGTHPTFTYLLGQNDGFKGQLVVDPGLIADHASHVTSADTHSWGEARPIARVRRALRDHKHTPLLTTHASCWFIPKSDTRDCRGMK